MAHKPWIPHFGNHIPYTTEAEDKVNTLKEELEKAMGELRKDDPGWTNISSPLIPARPQA